MLLLLRKAAASNCSGVVVIVINCCRGSVVGSDHGVYGSVRRDGVNIILSVLIFRISTILHDLTGLAVVAAAGGVALHLRLLLLLMLQLVLLLLMGLMWMLV